jgi:hypothetical protein
MPARGGGTYTPPRIILSSTVEAGKEKMKSSEKESEREREIIERI